MAILAENVNPFHKEIFMSAAVRRMADKTVLFRRRMYPDKRPAFIGMAGIAEQVRTFRLDHSP
jgi:hypothetical protein